MTDRDAEALRGLEAHLTGFLKGGFVPEEGQQVVDSQTGMIGPYTGAGTSRAALALGQVDGGGEVRDGSVGLDRIFPLTPSLGEATRFWRVTAIFENEGDTYGAVSFNIAARTEDEAMAAARHGASMSSYDDDRVPDRLVSYEVEEWSDMLADLDVLEEFREGSTPR